MGSKEPHSKSLGWKNLGDPKPTRARTRWAAKILFHPLSDKQYTCANIMYVDIVLGHLLIKKKRSFSSSIFIIYFIHRFMELSPSLDISSCISWNLLRRIIIMWFWCRNRKKKTKNNIILLRNTKHNWTFDWCFISKTMYVLSGNLLRAYPSMKE